MYVYQKQVGCMAEAMFFEARSEGVVGRYAVARNILKRFDIQYRGAETVCQVVHTPKQYSYLWDGHVHVVLQQELDLYNQVFKEAEEILYQAALNELPEYNIGDCNGGATHYHRYDVSPSWSDPETGSMKQVCGRVGKHIFFNGY